MKDSLWSEHEQDFWGTHLNEAEDKHFQAVWYAVGGEFLKMRGASHRWVKKPALGSGKGELSALTI